MSRKPKTPAPAETSTTLPPQKSTATVPPSSATKSGNDNTKQWLAWTLQFFAVVAPVLIATNYLYSAGYIEALGIDADLFSRSPDQHITKSFSTIMVLLPRFLTNYFAGWGIFVLVIIVTIIAYILLPKIPAPKFLQRWAAKHLLASEKGQSITMTVLIGYVVFHLPIVILLCFLVVAAPVYLAGQKDAIEKIDAFVASGSCTPTAPNPKRRAATCVKISLGKDEKPIDGLLLIASDKAIAIYDPLTTGIRLIYPKDGAILSSTFRPETIHKKS